MDHSDISDKAYLMLDDGSLYKGNAVGKTGTVIGEICFDTNMTGYQEVFSDPSSAHRIVLCTHSHIGNYGCKKDEQESSEVDVSGVVCRNFSRHYSRKKADESLQTYLESGNVVGIENVDTRALVRKIRKTGFMKAIISSEISDPDLLMGKLKSAADAAEKNYEYLISDGKEPYTVEGSDGNFRIALFDFGLKKSFLEDLVRKNCLVKVFPVHTNLKDVIAWGPDGIIIYGGPGNPASYENGIKLAQELLKSDKPVLGVGLGHQLLALAAGAETERMGHGHRGANHPVLNRVTGLADITLQNHGFSVKKESAERIRGMEVTHVNLNDGTVEGLSYSGKKVSSVQFYPLNSEAMAGSRNVLDEFLSEINKNK